MVISSLLQVFIVVSTVSAFIRSNDTDFLASYYFKKLLSCANYDAGTLGYIQCVTEQNVQNAIATSDKANIGNSNTTLVTSYNVLNSDGTYGNTGVSINFDFYNEIMNLHIDSLVSKRTCYHSIAIWTKGKVTLIKELTKEYAKPASQALEVMSNVASVGSWIYSIWTDQSGTSSSTSTACRSISNNFSVDGYDYVFTIYSYALNGVKCGFAEDSAFETEIKEVLTADIGTGTIGACITADNDGGVVTYTKYVRHNSGITFSEIACQGRSGYGYPGLSYDGS